MSEQSLGEKMKFYDDFQKELLIEKQLLLEKALKSGNPTEMLRANDIIGQQRKINKSKSYLVDPFEMNQNLGFKDKPANVTYNVLRGMGKTPIIRAIIGTRVEQIARFSEPQNDDQKIGWSVRKKKKIFTQSLQDEMTDQDKGEAEELIEFINNCGVEKREYHGDNFDMFLRKFTKDSMELDQGTFEVVHNRGMKPIEWFATDGGSHRLASSYSNASPRDDQSMVNGYYPFYVQLYQGIVSAEYYPWELCFGTRNISTSIFNNGYGESELENMIKIVTWMLYGDNYNGKFFSQGSSPKGILQMKGNVDDDKLNEFRTQWRQQVAGVENAWKVPVLQADEMQWIDLQKSNADMEFGNWQQYLIRLSCALYKIAPEEIGFSNLNQGQGGTTYEGNQEYKLQYSQDKGLLPLLKFIQRKLNQYIVGPKTTDKWEFYWTGLDDETDDSTLEKDIQKLGNFMGLKEIRKKNNLPPELDKDDVILNAQWISQQQMKMQGNQNSNDAMMQEAEGQNPFIVGSATDNPNPYLNNGSQDEEAENPFMKDLLQYYDKELIHKNK